MKFRTTLLVPMVLLVVAMGAATAGGAALVLERDARRDVAADLGQGVRIFEALREKRRSLYRAEAHVVAEEPRLKAVVATEDVSPETVYGVALELRKAVQSDLFLMTDGEGHLLADVADPKASGFDMSKNPAIAAALAEGEKAAVWTNEDKIYEVHARRLAFGTDPVGVLVVGFALGDPILEEVRRETGSVAVLLLDERPVSVSRLEGGEEAPRDAIAQVAAAIPRGGEPAPVTLGGGRYLAASAPIEGGAPGVGLRLVLLRSLDHALAPARQIEALVLALALGALAAAGAVAFVLSRRLARPIDALMSLAGELAQGKLEARAQAGGPVELSALGEAMNRMAGELFASRQQMAEKERLEKELEISSRIQTSILPRRLAVEGLDVAARMIPASEVGGDYYDVFPVEDGGWIGVGDVAGHGLTSGLIMLMVQSTIAALGRDDPRAAPRDLVRVLNLVLYENIRHRLGNDEHVTISVMRYHRDGRVIHAGAHEDIVICRADTGRVEVIPTLGPWVGAMRDVSRTVQDEELHLRDGDLMVLYTDGVTEARSDKGEQFGIDRLVAKVEALQKEPVERIRDEILDEVARWAPKQDDDVTLLVLRYHAPVKGAA
ncbi:PP2C family protein-serine/threonine phosphatase [Polyangium aurulentum]|uniref:PP2C family protein-serine/threonine phosphatase n=1 Tax=Polyangium aurulentum TaxID=2567896 RepID=UPI0010AE520A|nr:PP2C family protein-serine/threonine phosphatase [Polyangium aurulentum]UQA59344.1 SpoIIE family protein phosphatase [Polyangium aurulentum]